MTERVAIDAQISDRFMLPTRAYNKQVRLLVAHRFAVLCSRPVTEQRRGQYSHIYFHRIRQLRPTLTARAREAYPDGALALRFARPPVAVPSSA